MRMCRSSKLADYTLEHNALVGRAVLDASQAQGPGLKEASAPNRVLIGHSLGGVCAALEAVRSPQVRPGLVAAALSRAQLSARAQAGHTAKLAISLSAVCVRSALAPVQRMGRPRLAELERDWARCRVLWLLSGSAGCRQLALPMSPEYFQELL